MTWRALLLTALLVFPVYAWAETALYERAEILIPATCFEPQKARHVLNHNYGRKERAYFVNRDGDLLQLYVGPDGSWSLVYRHRQERSCILLGGDGWGRPDGKGRR